MKNIFSRGNALGWRPDVDAYNAPEGALLRADNLTLDATGALTLRLGSVRTYGDLTSSDDDHQEVQSIYSTLIDVEGADTITDVAVCYDKIYTAVKDEASMSLRGDMGGTATDDVAFGDDSYQVFMARGDSKKKWDGERLLNWGIARPSTKPSLTAGAVNSTTFFDFDGSEAVAGAVTVTEGTGTPGNTSGHDGTASAAIELTPDTKTGRATITKVFTADQNMLAINDQKGGDTDLIDFYVAIEEPKKVDKVTVMFGLDDSATNPFKKDYYFFDFNLKEGEEVNLKDDEAYGYASFSRVIDTLLTVTDPADVTKVKSVDKAKKVLKARKRAGSKSTKRQDSSTSAVWTHFTVLRGQLQRVGSTSGRDWQTVRGIKIVYDAVSGSTEKVYLDDLIVIGGGDRALTGTFTALYRYANYSSSGAYYELSPVSPVSDPIVLNQQTLSMTLPSAIFDEADEQVDQVWLYLAGGVLDTFYRVAIIPFTATGGYWSLDEFTRAADGSPATSAVIRTSLAQAHTGLNQDQIKLDASASAVNDYYNDTSITILDGTDEGDHRTISDYDGTSKVATVSSNFTSGPDDTSHFTIYADSHTLTSKDRSDLRIGMQTEMGVYSGTAPTTIVFVLKKSELDILIDGEALEPGTISIPDDVVAIAGPYHNRLFLATADGYVYPTSNTSPSNCSVFHSLDLRRYGTPKWMLLTTGGVYVGMTKDIIHIGGSGAESEDRATLDYFPEPLNISSPPVDACAYTDGNSIIYRSSDGLQVLSGVSITPVPTAGTSLLWRGHERHGVPALNTNTGRFRMAVDNNILYLLVTEGEDTTPTALWRVTVSGQSTGWERLVYPDTLLSIFQCDDGRLLVGTDSGAVLELENGQQDTGASGNTTDVSFYIQWPWLDGGNPLAQKDAIDVQVEGSTSGDTVTLSLFQDGSADATGEYDMSAVDSVFRADITDVGRFLRIQPTIQGNATNFVLRSFNMTTIPLVQHAMAVDTGYIMPGEPSDRLWLQEAEVDCSSPSNLTFQLYFEDTLKTTQTITVTPNKRKPYLVPLPRNAHGYRPRIVVKTTASSGAGQIGFECWRIRLRAIGSGNFFEVPFQINQPVGGD